MSKQFDGRSGFQPISVNICRQAAMLVPRPWPVSAFLSRGLDPTSGKKRFAPEISESACGSWVQWALGTPPITSRLTATIRDNSHSLTIPAFSNGEPGKLIRRMTPL